MAFGDEDHGANGELAHAPHNASSDLTCAPHSANAMSHNATVLGPGRATRRWDPQEKGLDSRRAMHCIFASLHADEACRPC